MPFDENVVTIGNILKPVGLHGEVKVEPLTDVPERFDELHDVMVLTEGQERLSLTISKVRYGLPFIYLSFCDLRNYSDVSALRGGALQIPASERISLPEGSYFHSDLIGMDVYTGKGVFIGKVTDILETGSNDILVVDGKTGESLIPAIKKFVTEVDLEQQQICIDPIEGLLEL